MAERPTSSRESSGSSRASSGKIAKAILRIEDLQVFYGESHALQGVSLTLESGVLSVVGRNGMGKSTLCNTIVGLKRAKSGSIRVDGREISALEPHEIHRLGVGYVPQGRRVWPSLTVDEHLRLAAGNRRDASWTVERVYQTFPRLAERRGNGGSQLSGGEQQMLAISRALLSDPKLLVMDEPTEGLAPIIVEQVEQMLIDLAAEGEMAVLVIEQNIGVATAVSNQVAIMVNGRINRLMDARALAADRELQQRLLGVGRHAEEAPVTPADAAQAREQLAEVYRVDRTGAGSAEPMRQNGIYRPVTDLPNRWNVPVTELRQAAVDKTAPQDDLKKVFAIPFAERIGRTVLVVGTFDTKGKELRFVTDRLKSLGIPVRTVDLSTSGRPTSADVPAMQVAGMHARGSSSVFTNDRGGSVSAMAEAFARWIEREPRIGGVISAGGSGGTTLATAGMRVLPVGIPKLMVSTVAAGDVAKYVGGADIMMFHSVADVQGLNSITEQVLSNAAHAMAGMVAQLPNAEAWEAKRKLARPAVGITMFGVTTPAVQAVTKRLEADYDCLVFHATGIGGRAMETLGDSRLLSAFLDLTTTEVADMIVGGVFPATEDRFGAAIRTGLPYVGSTGALDMVNFGPRDSVPEKFRSRKFVIHNPNVTLMRTTRDENRAFGEWIGARLNAMNGPVRFLLPEGGVSMLDAPDQPFHDPEADNVLFEAIEKTVRRTPLRHVERVRGNINDTPFVDAVISAFHAITPKLQRRA
ncbi:ABC transporter permease [Mesorhizobium helmanticense]|uniref:ABC transporter permease n=1 Tax=Mesorhizobium helmanticense TaxID=1776423 RepID=UPI003CCA3557